MKHVRNFGIVVLVAAALAFVPGGGPTLGVVLKYEEDIRRVRGDTARAYLQEASA